MFELSKCQRLDIRQRMVAGLRNVDEDLARDVADGLGLTELPDRLEAARPPRTDLPPSPALSILANGPGCLRGPQNRCPDHRRLRSGCAEPVCKPRPKPNRSPSRWWRPRSEGPLASDGSLVSADQKLDGAPSVLYDAVVIAASEQGAAELASSPAARDFVSDAYAHGKFIGYTAPTMALFSACGLDQPYR